MKTVFKKIRMYYEQELSAMRGFNAEFAAEFPALAGSLGMQGSHCDDPHVERFIQATALSNARTAKLIDDTDCKVTEALLQVNYPHYLQPFPSSAIVRVDMRAGVGKMTAPGLIARGAMLGARVASSPVCQFQTVYDVPLTPVVLAKAAFSARLDLPLSLPRPPGVGATLSIDIECMSANFAFAQLKQSALRTYIDAEQSLCATIRDVLFMHAKAAYLEINGAWIALKGVPIKQVGFTPQESLLPRNALSHHAYLLLTEYFVYPAKFNFFDIDWAALAPHLPPDCRRVTLHLGLAGVPADSHVAHALGQLSSDNFLLGCTPVVNLFKRPACPIELTHRAPDYELIPEGSPAMAYDIYSVDKVTTVQESHHGQALTEFRPYYSLRHGEAGGRNGRYYVVRRDQLKALSDPGHETRITFVDLDLDPLAIPDASVSIDLTCTNRDLPSRLGGTGELTLEQTTEGLTLRFLRKPTAQYRFSADDHWRLISHLALSHCALSPDGLNLLKETLTLYDLPQSPVSRRQIAGIVGLEHRTVSARMRDDGHNGMVRGLAVRVTLDEEAFAGTGLHLFVSVLDHFFSLYVHFHSFTQLTVLSQASGKELIQCPPRSGALNLLCSTNWSSSRNGLISSRPYA